MRKNPDQAAAPKRDGVSAGLQRVPDGKGGADKKGADPKARSPDVMP